MRRYGFERSDSPFAVDVSSRRAIRRSRVYTHRCSMQDLIIATPSSFGGHQSVNLGILIPTGYEKRNVNAWTPVMTLRLRLLWTRRRAALTKRLAQNRGLYNWDQSGSGPHG